MKPIASEPNINIPIACTNHRRGKRIYPSRAPIAAYIFEQLLGEVPEVRKAGLASFVVGLLKMYKSLHFAYMEINPLVVLNNVLA